MESSQQSVLKVLGEWWGKRLRKAYTDEDFKKIARKYLRIVEEINPEELENAKTYVFDCFSEEALANSWTEGFSRMYSSLETETEVLGIDTTNISQELREKYLGPYERCCRKMGSLVDKLRNRFDDTFPEELSEKDIEIEFKEEFPNPEDYAEFFCETNKALDLAYSLKKTRGDMEREDYDFFEKCSEELMEEFKDISRRMFADLYEK